MRLSGRWVVASATLSQREVLAPGLLVGTEP
jgi:hypothetical protein